MSILQLHYTSLEQRVAAAFYHGLIKTRSEDLSQRELQTFFHWLYRALYENPESFGFKLQPDDYLIEGEENEKDHKQELTRKMKKSRDVLIQFLRVLMHLGVHGCIDGDKLTLPTDDLLAKAFRSRNQRNFFTGMAALGFHLNNEGEQVRFHSEPAPNMLPALQSLAQACAGHAEPRTGFFNFWRCDFAALEIPNHTPSVEDLYTLFMEADQKRLLALHSYFIEHGYQPEISIHDTNWEIKYQGDRKVKSTPLYQITHEDRYDNPMRVYIKPASTNRLAGLLPQQSGVLQADFNARAYTCRGDDCGWCYNKKSLGTTKMVFNGETRVVCWYTNPMVSPFTDESIPLIKEYEQMHARLADV